MAPSARRDFVIESGGEQKGAIFEQLTYLPDNIKQFDRAVLNSTVVALSVTALTLAFGSMSAYTVARLRFRWLTVFMQANVVACGVIMFIISWHELLIPLILNSKRWRFVFWLCCRRWSWS